MSFLKKNIIFVFSFGCAGASLLQGLFSSCGEQGPLFIEVYGLLIVVASLVAEYGLRAQASVVVVPRLQNTGSIAVMHGLSCFAASGIFPDQALNPCFLHWQADSLPLSHPNQGSPDKCLLKRFEYAKSYILIYVVTCSVFIIPLCRS